MIGWWEDVEQGAGTTPVQCSREDVKITVFLKKGEAAMIVIADWNETAPVVTFTLSYNWVKLGLSKTTATLHAPEVDPFQLAPVAKGYELGELFSVNVTQGGLLLLLTRG